MRRPLSLEGARFTRWLVMSKVDTSKPPTLWLCRCDCGTEKAVSQGNLRNGASKSCGCLRNEISSVRITAQSRTHGKSHTLEYKNWAAMKKRCYYKHDVAYKYYGGIGITVCTRWRDDFSAFLEDVGLRPTPKHTLDRINNDGNYEPGNCRWATQAQQLTNRQSLGWKYLPRKPFKDPSRKNKETIKWAKSMLAATQRPGVDPKWATGVKSAVLKKLKSIA